MGTRSFLEVLRRRWWLLLVSVAVGAGLLGGLTFAQPVRYEPEARIVVVPATSGGAIPRESERWVSSQREIILSVGPNDPAVQEAARASASDVRSRLIVTSRDDSNVLRIRYPDGAAARATAVVDAVVDAYLSYREDVAATRAESMAERLDKQIDVSRSRLDDVEDRLRADGASNSERRVLLEVERETLESGLAALYQDQQRASLGLDEIGAVEVLERPTEPSDPLDRSPIRNAAAGAVIGLLIGIALALFRETLDEKVRSVEGLEASTSLPVLGKVGVDRKPSPVAAVADTPFAGALQALGTTLRVISRTDESCRILVVGPELGVGTSLIAANLASAFAAAGHSTVVVDADVRQQKVTEMLGGRARFDRGLGTILRVRATAVSMDWAQGGVESPLKWDEAKYVIRDAIVETSVPQLSLLPAGPNGSAVIGMDDLPVVLETLGECHAAVIVDAPPMLSVPDALFAAGWADVALVVAEYGESTLSSIERCHELLNAAGCATVGVVINKVPARELRRWRSSYGPTLDVTSEQKRDS